jgi:hypothetical protein
MKQTIPFRLLQSRSLRPQQTIINDLVNTY